MEGTDRPPAPLVVRAMGPDMVAELLAQRIAGEIRRAQRERGRAIVALSGGSTPWGGYRALAGQAVPWEAVDLVQVDERIAPDGDPARNATGLLEHLPPPALDRLHLMAVEPPDAAGYGELLGDLAGRPPVLDVAVLGVGPDGHTASLVPGDAVLDVDAVPVATTGEYQGHRRMTMTFPVLDAARCLVVVATGDSKRDAVGRMLAGDRTVPAGRLPHDHLIAILDTDALG